MLDPAVSVIRQLDTLLIDVEEHLEPQGTSGTLWYRGPDDARVIRTRLLAAVHRLSPVGSAYRESAEAVDERGGIEGYVAGQLAGIVRALRDDFAAGYMRTVEELVHADLFADFLEMADELLDKGYKDPAAVLAGSVLEEHLRKLAVRSSLDIETSDGKHKKTDTINADLAKVPVYNKTEQKAVTAWLGLRNDAAHGDYGKYDKGHVEALIRDVRAFMMRHPA